MPFKKNLVIYLPNRWVRFDQFRFNLSSLQEIADNIITLDEVILSSLTIEDISNKYRYTNDTQDNMTAMQCANNCISGSGCDMFEFNPRTQSCIWSPHLALKSHPWESFVVKDEQEGSSVFVLQCSTAIENIMVNDHSMDYDGGQLLTKKADFLTALHVISAIQRTKYIIYGNCAKLRAIATGILFNISLPVSMGESYIKAFEPVYYI
jgi:hypothetical protein